MLFLSILKYIRLRKLLNLVLVYSGYGVSVLFKKVFIWGYPIAASIETSSICNLCCPECPTGNNTLNRKTGLMSFHDFRSIIDQIKKYVFFINLSLQGEPFLNNELFEMIIYARKNNLFTSLSTNGHFLDKETIKSIIDSGLHKIIISIDGTDQETYEKYRKGGSYEEVVNGIINLSKQKLESRSKYPEIVLQFIVFKHNEHQISEIKKLSKNLGADKIEIKSAQINFKNHHIFTPTQEKYNRYKLEYDGYVLKSKIKNQCFRIWETFVITWDGNIIPCCFDKSAEYKVGDITENKIFAVWKSLSFNNFRKNILSNRKKTNICCNCTEGLRIRY